MTDATPRVFQTSGRVWLKDFEFGLTGLKVRKTGAHVPYSPSVLKQVYAWFAYFFSAQRIEPATPSFTIAFSPERARPWYLIWAVSRAAGAQYEKDISKADVVMHFEDATYSPNDPPVKLKPGAKLINFNARDVSKSNVSRACGVAFATLAVDPTKHVGQAVEKSEINAAHDGRIVQCPTQPNPGRVYQRVIDNRMASNPNWVEDLRTCTVGGKPVCVFLKRREVTKRFLNTNTEVLLRAPDEVFTPDEMQQIGVFTREIGLDWGGVDVLRDRADGRLYIVDANKTDMGPPIGLNLPDKLVATRKLAKAFRAFARGSA